MFSLLSASRSQISIFRTSREEIFLDELPDVEKILNKVDTVIVNFMLLCSISCESN